MEKKFYLFEDNINTESINNLIKELELLEGKINLYFTTNGGVISCMNILVEYLNQRKNDINIIITDWLCSSGTILLFDFKGSITFHESLDYILFHKYDNLVHSIRKDNGIDGKKLLKFTKASNKKLRKKLNKFNLTKKDFKIFDKGHDLVIHKDRFKEVFPQFTKKEESL